MCVGCNCGLDNAGNVVDQERYNVVLIEGCDTPGCHEPQKSE